MLNTHLIEVAMNEMANQKDWLEHDIKRLKSDESNKDYFIYAKLKAARIKQLADRVIMELDAM